ncbi:MAG: acetate--CoA ligase family protein, partial [Micromonosporaceae bacterium]
AGAAAPAGHRGGAGPGGQSGDAGPVGQSDGSDPGGQSGSSGPGGPGAGAAVLVEEQVSGGVELLVGIAASPLGPVLTLGAGGVLTEVLDDVAVRLLPVDELDLRDLLAEIKVSKLLAGHRGTPAADLASLGELIRRLEELTAAWPPGFSLDLNPVLALPTRTVVLDAAYVPPDGPQDRDLGSEGEAALQIRTRNSDLEAGAGAGGTG